MLMCKIKSNLYAISPWGLNSTLTAFQNGVHGEVRGHNPAFQWQIHQDSTGSAWCVECLFLYCRILILLLLCLSSVVLSPTVITEFTLLFDVLLSQCPQSLYYVSLQTEVRRRGRTRGNTSRMDGPGLETAMRWDGHFHLAILTEYF